MTKTLGTGTIPEGHRWQARGLGVSSEHRTFRCSEKENWMYGFKRGSPRFGTHLAEGRKALCARVQATVPLLGIHRESAWEEKSLHSKEGAVAWGKEGPLFWEPAPRAGGWSCHLPFFPSFPSALLHDSLRTSTPSFYLPVHLSPGSVTS